MSQVNTVISELKAMPGEAWREVTRRWRADGAQRWLMALVWVTLVLTIAVNLIFLLLRWPGVLELPTNAPSFLGSLFLYSVGGRLVVLLVMLVATVWFGLRSRAGLFTVAWVYHLAGVINLDERFRDLIGSDRDTLESVPLSDRLEPWPVFVGLVGFIALGAFIVLLGNVFARSKAYRRIREDLRHVVGSRRISELILFWILVAESAIYVLVWIAFYVEGSVFSTLTYYSVLGRLIIWLGYLVLLSASLRSRGVFLTLALANFLVKFLGVDGIIQQEFVERLRQTDDFFPVLYNSDNYQGAVQLLGLLGFFIPVFLLWILLVSIGGVVRRRTRTKIEAWIDTRRTAIYGAEDQGDTGPRRVSVLAVFALVFSIVLPILGLVLAYAARNDMVAAQPRKSGLDLAVAATIISWFVLGVQLFLVVITVVVGLLGGTDPLGILLDIFTGFFGWGALDPFGGAFLDAFLGAADF